MIEYRSLREEELEKWADHCVLSFNKGVYDEDYRQHFLRHWYNDPWKDINGILVAVDDDKIVSTVRVFYRDVFYKGRTIKLGGIGEVCTNEKYRGKNLSTGLLKKSIDLMQDAGVNYSLLGTGRCGFYARVGFISIPYVFKTAVPQDYSTPYSFSIRPIDFDKDVEQLKKIYNDYNKNLNGSTVRNDEYWDKWIRHEFSNAWAACDDKNKIIAYVSFQIDKSNVFITEFGSDNIHSDIFAPFLYKVCNSVNNLIDEWTFPTVVKTPIKIKDTIVETWKMVRLVDPFIHNGQQISTTEQFIESFNEIKGSNESGTFTCWSTDGF